MSELGFRSTKRFPLGLVFWSLVTVTILVFAVIYVKMQIAWAAIPPIFCCIAAYLTRPKPWTLKLTQAQLEVPELGVTVPLDELQAVSPFQGFQKTGRPRGGESFSMCISHRHGQIVVPAKITPSSERLHDLLLDLQKTSGSREVHADLEDYLRSQLETFGPDLVWSFVGRPHFGMWPSRPRLRAYALAFLAGGLCLIGLGIPIGEDGKGWIGVGSLLAIFGFLCSLLTLANPNSQIKKMFAKGKPSLVVSPKGIALVHGELKGEMKWSELKSIGLGMRHATFAVSYAHVGSLRLQVHGAEFWVHDVFDRPIQNIHALMQDYWQKGK